MPTPEEIAAQELEIKFNNEVQVRIAKILPDEIAKALPKVPDKYELKLPEKASISTEDLPVIADIAKSLGLSQDKASVLVDVLDSHNKNVMDAFGKALSKTVTKWQTDMAADEELGGKDGSKVPQTDAAVEKFLSKFGSPELKEFLGKSGNGKNPVLVRALLRAANAMKDDVIDIGSNRSVTGSKKSTADKLYGPGTEVGSKAA